MTATFAPPTGPPVTGGEAASPMASPPIEPDGRRSRIAGVLLATAAVAALVVGAFVVVAGNGSSGSESQTFAAFSLVGAAEQTIAADTVEFDLSVSAGGVGDVAMSGAVDNTSGVLAIAVDLDSVLPVGDLGAGGSVEMIVDAESGTLYFGAEELGGLVPGGAGWISADLGVLAEMSGESLDDLRGEMFLDPTESAQMLLDADQVVEIGPETIEGDATVRYEVTVDVAAALAATPQAGAELDAQGIDIPDTVVYDVWVTEDNQLRRATFELDVAGQTVSTTLEMRASDEALGVEIPTDAFDITALIDGF